MHDNNGSSGGRRHWQPDCIRRQRLYRIRKIRQGSSFDFEEHMIRNRREYCYDLDLLTLGPDTAREIAVDMIRDQTMRAMDRKNIFDGHVECAVGGIYGE